METVLKGHYWMPSQQILAEVFAIYTVFNNKRGVSEKYRLGICCGFYHFCMEYVEGRYRRTHKLLFWSHMA